MKRSLRQIGVLLIAALRIDIRTRDPIAGRISRSSWGLASGLAFYALVGACLSLLMPAQVPPHVRLVTYLSVAAIYVAFNILIEYQQILMAPEDHEILGWQPISSATLLAARCTHVLVYVSVLSGALLFVPALTLMRTAPERSIPVFVSFVVAAFLNTVLATSLTVTIYTLILHVAPTRQFKKALAGVQVVMSLVLILGYQLVGPVFDRVDPQKLAEPPWWFELLPATWFASLPLTLGWGTTAAPLWPSAAGVLLVLVTGTLAARWISPQYAARLTRVEATVDDPPGVAGRAASRAEREPRLQSWVARAIVRHPLRQAGFRFFLSNLHGDRRLYATLVQVMALPVVLLGMALFFGDTRDPYGTHSGTSTSGIYGGSAPGSAQGTGSFTLFAAAYVLAMMVPTATRLLKSSPSWRAAWIVFSSPTRHYDRFYSGVLLGVSYGLVLPTAGLLVIVLLLIWRNPVHVLAHMALPMGTAMLAFPILLRLDAQVPFSCAPARHERTRELLRAVATLVPIGVIAYAHSTLRTQPMLLIVVGVLLSAAGISLWPGLARRVRLLPHQRAFHG